MSRDSQRQRVYNAENKARKLMTEAGLWFTDVATEARYRARIDAIMGSAWMQEHYPAATRRKVELTWSTRRRGGACAGIVGITTSITDFALHELVLLHELAHTIQKRTGEKDPGHGRIYCRIYLRLVRRFVGQLAYNILRDCFKEAGVRYIVRKAPPCTAGLKMAASLPPALAARNAERSRLAAAKFAIKARKYAGAQVIGRGGWVKAQASRDHDTGVITFWARCGHVERHSDALSDAELYQRWKEFQHAWVA